MNNEIKAELYYLALSKIYDEQINKVKKTIEQYEKEML